MRFMSSQLRRAAWLCCAVILAVSVTACKDDKISAELSVSTLSVNVPENGVTTSIVVTSNVPWTISDNGDNSWYSYSPTEGKDGITTITVTVDANTILTTRTVDLTVTANEKTAKITVSQDAMGARMNVTPDHIDFDKTVDMDTVLVKTNLNWTIAVDAAATWCTLSVAGGSANDSIVKVNVTANDVATDRTATLTVKATGTADRSVSITQEAASTLSLSATTLTVDYRNRPTSQSNYTIDVTSNTDWTIAKNSSATFTSTNINSGSSSADFNVLFSGMNFSRNNHATTYTVATTDGAVSKQLYVQRLAEVAATTFTETWGTATHQDSVFNTGNWWGNKDNGMAWTVFSDINKQYAVADVNKGVAGQDYELWMISPALDLANASIKKASFHSQVTYALTTSSVEVFLLDTKEGTPSTATKLPAITATAALYGNSDWIASGDIDLSGFSGIKYIGIRYKALGGGQTGGTGRTATAFHVDNFTFGVPSIDILRVSPATITATTAATTTAVSLYTTKNWEAIITPASASSWCTFSSGSTTSGNAGNRTFNVLITENEEPAVRAATVTISMAGSSLTQNIAVTQESAAPVLAKWNIATSSIIQGVYETTSDTVKTADERSYITKHIEQGTAYAFKTPILGMKDWYKNDYVLLTVNTADNNRIDSLNVHFTIKGSPTTTAPGEWTIEWVNDITGKTAGTATWNRNIDNSTDFQLPNAATSTTFNIKLGDVQPLNNKLFIRLRVRSGMTLNKTDKGSAIMAGTITFTEKITLTPLVR